MSLSADCLNSFNWHFFTPKTLFAFMLLQISLCNNTQLNYNCKATEQKIFGLTRRTLQPVCSCTWHRIHYPRRCHWWALDMCSWGCSTSYYNRARAAYSSMKQISNTETRLWWRCSKSPHTMQWRSQCSPRLRRKVTNILLVYGQKFCFICFRPLFALIH